MVILSDDIPIFHYLWHSTIPLWVYGRGHV